MYCKNCGKKIKEGNIFCTNCGSSINENTNRNIEPIRIKLSSFLILVGAIVIIFIICMITFGKKNNTNQSMINGNLEPEEVTEVENERNILEVNDQLETDNVEETLENAYDDTAHLLERIYAKHPELKGKEGIICTNDNNEYWLLDEDGKKMYFTDMESFENALTKCPTKQNILNNNSSNNTNKNTTNTNNYIQIPDLSGMTEQQAKDAVKDLGVKYKISYSEDTNYDEGVVIGQTEHSNLITDVRGRIVTGYTTRKISPR